MKITGTQSAAYGNASIMEGWNMQHKATGLKFLEGTVLEVTFQDGRVRRYDIAVLFNRYFCRTVRCECKFNTSL